MLYPTCAPLLIVRLPATGASRLFPWGAYELGPPELRPAAKLWWGEEEVATRCVPWDPCPQALEGRKPSLLCIDRGTRASPESLLARAGSHAGTVPRTEPRRSYQQPWGWLKLSRALLLVSVTVVCLLLTAPAHLFFDCKFLVLTNPSQVVGERWGEDVFNDSISDRVDVL